MTISPSRTTRRPSCMKRGNIVDQSAGRFPAARHIAAQAVRGSEAHLGKIRSALLRSIQPALTKGDDLTAAGGAGRAVTRGLAVGGRRQGPVSGNDPSLAT